MKKLIMILCVILTCGNFIANAEGFLYEIAMGSVKDRGGVAKELIKDNLGNKIILRFSYIDRIEPISFPDSLQILIDQFNESLEKGDIKGAYLLINGLIKLNNINPSYYFIKGTICEQLNKIDEAIESYQKSLELDAVYSDSFWNLGSLYYNRSLQTSESNQINEYLKTSLSYYKEFKKLNPSDTYIDDAISMVEKQMGKYTLASTKKPITELEVEVIGKDIILIKKGFSYKNDSLFIKMGIDSTVLIVKEVVNGQIFTIGTAAFNPEKSVWNHYYIGTKWIFPKAGMTFKNGDYSYTSKIDNASIEFKASGVLLKGFSYSQR